MGVGFTPEVLIQSVWRCLLLQMLETFVIKMGLSTMQVPLPVLDVFAYTGYKYVGLCLSTLSKGLGSTFSYLIALYTCLTVGYFVLKALAAVVPATVTTGPPRHLMLLGFAGIQMVVQFILFSL